MLRTSDQIPLVTTFLKFNYEKNPSQAQNENMMVPKRQFTFGIFQKHLFLIFFAKRIFSMFRACLPVELYNDLLISICVVYTWQHPMCLKK